MNKIINSTGRIEQSYAPPWHRNWGKTVIIAAFTAALGAFATPATTQIISDAALEECRAETVPFTSVASCAPMTQVALDMLAVIDEPHLLGPAGAELSQRCAETTSRAVEQWNCVRIAVDEAAQLRAMIEDPARVGDPLFADLSDPERQAAFAKAVEEAVHRVYSAGE
ncbi:hypothetical protein [Limimaricola cinnabarinus]|uniref:hypothetical protein n=1 Tax=Limimaricola cinnabarinus TaxID=1125964 RepID=UPI0013A5FA9B|nr:hypothetical protein [Limimaricola cinnabarinus]